MRHKRKLSTKKTFPKTIFFLFIGLLVLIPLFLFQLWEGRQVSELFSTYKPKYTLTRGNLIVYSRCSKDEDGKVVYTPDSPTKCNVYAKNFGKHDTETLVQSFLYSTEGAEGNWGGLRLHRVIKNNIVYSESYYDTKLSDNIRVYKETIGIISLKTGRKKVLEKFSGQSKIKEDDSYGINSNLRNVIINPQRDTVFYQTSYFAGPGVRTYSSDNATDIRHAIKAYSPVQGEIITVADNAQLGSGQLPRFLYFALDDSLLVGNAVGCFGHTLKKLDLPTGRLSDTPFNGDVFGMQINNVGDKIAYIQHAERNEKEFVERLILANIDGTGQKTILTQTGGYEKRSQGFCGFATTSIKILGVSPEGDSVVFVARNGNVVIPSVWNTRPLLGEKIFSLEQADPNFEAGFKSFLGIKKLEDPNFTNEFIYCPKNTCNFSSFIVRDPDEAKIENRDSLALDANDIFLY